VTTPTSAPRSNAPDRAARSSNRRAIRDVLNLPPGHAFDYKDIGLLKYFLTSQGKIVSRRLSGLTGVEHNDLVRAVKRARHIALAPYASHQ
jgi:small subunit ribosomal protein S18